MFRKHTIARAASLAFTAGLGMAAAIPADAQPMPTADLARVVVTGSNVRRVDSETPSPVQVLTAADLRRSGYTSVNDVLQTLTSNGQGTLSQNFSGAFASGAAGVALRGLTVGATLVLIDGHRMAPYPIGDDGQRSFVDVSNIPFDSVERIEVLKDGASAVYGSDAIAGVVNIILKRSFVGQTITADLGGTNHGDGGMYHLSGTFGTGDLDNEGHNFYVAAEVRKRNQIKYSDRGDMFNSLDYSKYGGYNTNYGVPNGANAGLARSGTGYVTDPDGNIIGFMKGCDAASYSAGRCTYKDTWSQIQVPTENYNLLGRYTQRLASDWQFSVQGSFFESKAQQTAGPSRAFAGGYQGITSGPGVTPSLLASLDPTTISSTNPSFPAGTGATSGLLRYTFRDVGPQITNTDSVATRLIGDLSGHLGAWNLNASAGYTEVKLDIVGKGSVNAANLQTALDSTTNPYLVGGPNSASVLAFIAPELKTTNKSKLQFVHVGADRDLYTLPGGPMSFAVGADYVHRSQYAVAPADVAAGLIDSFSNNFTIGKQVVASAFAELVAPISKQFEAEAAVRYDHYNLSGGKASPKLGAKYTPIPELAIRGTAGRGFRAPGPAENGNSGQTFFTGTQDDPVLCPEGPTAVKAFPTQCAQSVGTVQSTTKTLKAETSKSYTLGFIVEPIRNLSVSLDFYSIDIENQIVPGPPGPPVRGTNFTPLPQIQADGTTQLVVPPVAPIAYYTNGYINANSTKTNGVDLNLQWKHSLRGIGDLVSDFEVTYVNRYDLKFDGTTYHLAGTHGPSIISGDTGTPRTRAKWSNTLNRDNWSLTGTFNYISSFSLVDPSADGQLDCASALSVGAGSVAFGNFPAGVVPPGVRCRVASFTTFDLVGRYDLSKQFSVHGSILNLFDRHAPYDWATYAGGNAPYNPSLHGAGGIGRYFTVGATYKF